MIHRICVVKQSVGGCDVSGELYGVETEWDVDNDIICVTFYTCE